MVHNDKIRSYVGLKGVSWVNNDKMRSNGLERSQLDYTILKSWSYGLAEGVSWITAIQKSAQMDLERSLFGYTVS